MIVIDMVTHAQSAVAGVQACLVCLAAGSRGVALLEDWRSHEGALQRDAGSCQAVRTP